MATQEEINGFANFALQQLHHGGSELNMDELYDMWRCQNPDPAVYAEDVAAVQGAINDLRNGDRGQLAGDLSRELRAKLRTASEE